MRVPDTWEAATGKQAADGIGHCPCPGSVRKAGGPALGSHGSVSFPSTPWGRSLESGRRENQKGEASWYLSNMVPSSKAAAVFICRI